MPTLESELESEKYHVLRELGRGGMGVVYLAEDKHLKRQVALKVLYEHLYRETAFVERFREEARSVSTLHHPHIVCVHGLEQSNGVVAIDMEFVDGHSLDILSGTNQMTRHITVSIARDVLSGLVACHGLGIVHRDIKPSNILLQHDGTAKLTDFGLATAYASHLEATVRGNTSSGFYMGTPRYMPVEAWEGGEPKPQWDVYSFGIVLYELLSGNAAFAGENPMAIMKTHLTEPLPLIQSVAVGISDELADLVDALVREPADSLLTSAEALRVLQEAPEYAELQDSNVVTTIAVSPLRRSLLRARRVKPQKRGTLIAGLLTTVIAVLWAITMINDRDSVPEPQPPSGRDQAVRFLTLQGNQNSNSEQVWMVEKVPNSQDLRISGYSEVGLVNLEARSVRPGQWELSGGWAELVYPQSRSFQYGTVQGNFYWKDHDNDAYIDVERIREADGLRTRLIVPAEASTEVQSRYDFLRGLENQEFIQSLIYNELLDAGIFAWGAALEALLPALPRSRYDIPYGAGEVVVDGKLEEDLWTREYFYPNGGTLGDVPPLEQVVPAALWARWCERGVIVAAQVDSDDPSLRFELGVMPGFEVSMKHSGRLVLECNQKGETSFQYFVEGVRKPNSFHWPVALHQSDKRTHIEMEIPAALLEESSRATAGKRWRVNARWTRSDGVGSREVVAQWGDSAFISLEHGALFIFQEANH